MKLRITVDGKTYEVDVDVAEQDAPHPGYIPPTTPTRVPAVKPVAAPPVRPGPGSVADESKVCRSPIAGVVVRVSAQPGQAIQVHDVLMVLEAMKMETTITSPLAGKVARVNAQVGDGVQSGQVLVDFE